MNEDYIDARNDLATHRGEADAARGRALAENPYPYASDMWYSWRSGWSAQTTRLGKPEPLADWERELLGTGTVVFTRTDGREVRIENARVDSIGPSAENPGVIGVEFFDSDSVVHVPFVESWIIEY